MDRSFDLAAFVAKMDELINRYVAPDQGLPPEDVTVWAAWYTQDFVYLIIEAQRGGTTYIGYEVDFRRAHRDVSAEVETAVHAWGDQMAGDSFVGVVPFDSSDVIYWWDARWVAKDVPRTLADIDGAVEAASESWLLE
ncbi:hypothetical protein NQ023_07930 [Corynebacterium phoceense]|uniref:hypothetical protein n=1 Tax=Corynebacterium phoceense TaxID=1686286 RepID=UPI00211BDD94|nr:hypothetical protein [Corynebacterium phoceense]MCQ9330410.1 hypothetical protein [Corynebacterium phoceense]MCQ9348395.1 hypothetical protein [Corynebacterium phoceense]